MPRKVAVKPRWIDPLWTEVDRYIGDLLAPSDEKLNAAVVVCGHTHRVGPLPADKPGEWRGREGARLVNAGNWTYAEIFLTETPGESPYWPGTCVIVEDSGPPTVRRLLQDRTHADIRPIALPDGV